MKQTLLIILVFFSVALHSQFGDVVDDRFMACDTLTGESVMVEYSNGLEDCCYEWDGKNWVKRPDCLNVVFEKKQIKCDDAKCLIYKGDTLEGFKVREYCGNSLSEIYYYLNDSIKVHCDSVSFPVFGVLPTVVGFQILCDDDCNAYQFCKFSNDTQQIRNIDGTQVSGLNLNDLKTSCNQDKDIIAACFITPQNDTIRNGLYYEITCNSNTTERYLYNPSNGFTYTYNQVTFPE